jgi:hypothetical protein
LEIIMTNNDALTQELETRACIFILTIHSLGNYRKIKVGTNVDIKVSEGEQVDRSLLGMTKRLMDAPEFKALESQNGEIRRYIDSVCLQSPFKAGTYTLPIGMLLEVDTRMQAFQAVRSQLVAALIDAYPRIKESVRVRLPGLYREADYPQADVLAKAYRLEWEYVQFATPGQLSALDAFLYAREREKMAQRWEEAAQEMRDALRGGLAEFVLGLETRLVEPRGKVKVPRQAFLDKFNTFLDTFSRRNITNDRELAAVVDQARDLLNGVSSYDLRSRTLRSSVKLGLEEMKIALDELGVELPRRRVVLED